MKMSTLFCNSHFLCVDCVVDDARKPQFVGVRLLSQMLGDVICWFPPAVLS